jgi:integrase/recombinase XerD
MAQAKTLTQADINKVLAYIAQHEYAERNKMMFLIGLTCGLRVSEIAGLTIGDVRNEDGTVKSQVYFSANRVKHGNARTVFVSTQLQAELQKYIDARTWLDNEQTLFNTLRGARKAFTASTLTQHFHYLFKRACVFGASSHSMRRTFLTNLAQGGISVFVLASLAGHKNISTTQRYVTVNDEQKRRAVDCFSLQVA